MLSMWDKDRVCKIQTAKHRKWQSRSRLSSLSWDNTQPSCVSLSSVPLSTQIPQTGFRGPEHTENSLNFKLIITLDCSHLSDTSKCTSKRPVLLYDRKETHGKSVHCSSSLIYVKFLLLCNIFPSFPPSLSGKYTISNNGY